MKTNYDVDYFIRKATAIPDYKWANGWGNIGRQEPTCFTGHCGFDNREHCWVTPENAALIKIFAPIKVHNKTGGQEFVDDRKCFSWKVIFINDGQTKEYQQKTPKQRILAALYDIKKMQQPKYADITKSLAVLPVDKIETDVIVKNVKI